MPSSVQQAKRSITGPNSSSPTQRKAARLQTPSRPVSHARSSVERTFVAPTPTTNRATHRSRSVRSRNGVGFSSYQSSTGSSESSIRLPQLAKHSASGAKTSTLIAEWLIAVVIIVWGVFDGTKDYISAMKDLIYRLVAVSVVFFVLALIMRGQSTSKVAVAFGAIIDLALILDVGGKGTFGAVASLLQGKGSGGATLTAADAAQAGVQTEHTQLEQIDNPDAGPGTETPPSNPPDKKKTAKTTKKEPRKKIPVTVA